MFNFTAITVEDAEMMARMQARGQPVRVKLVMNAQTLPDVTSRNILAEVAGAKAPQKIVAIGGRHHTEGYLPYLSLSLSLGWCNCFVTLFVVVASPL